MQTQIYQAQLQQFLEGDGTTGPQVDDTLIEAAGEEFKAALRKQFSGRTDDEFRIRMSNLGRPTCQLQMDAKGADKMPRKAPFIIQMMIGDAVECITRMVIKASGINVTSDGDKVELEVDGEIIRGESDIDLDGDVYDIKSASDWAFNNKWAKGYHALSKEDPFGYVSQLVGYADAQKKPLGGWVVGNKSTGEIIFVGFEGSKEDVEAIREERQGVVRKIKDNAPFERCFDDEPEVYYKKPTGSRVLPFACKFCDYMKACRPDAQFLPQTVFKGKGAPPMKWYTEYAE